jgi:hypothetical protein
LAYLGILRACVAAAGLALTSLGAHSQTPAADEGWPAGEQLVSRFKAGKYAEVIAGAPRTLQAEPWNNELRLAYATSLLWSGRESDAVEQFRMLLNTELGVDARLGLANALAWSGRAAESLPHYRLLLDGPQGSEARLGMANALRWMGRDDLALPHYQQLRAAHPDKDIGEEGLFYARRATRARTTFGSTFNRDNSPTRRHEPLVSHEWRDASLGWIFGVEATGGQDWNANTKLPRREYGFRVESLDAPLSPRLSVSRQTEPEGKTFADLRLRVTDWPLAVNVGRVNWGKLAFTVPAIDQGLTANRYGIEGAYPIALGELKGYANHFSISDDNRIDNGDVRLTSRWRPLGQEIKPFAGVHWRRSDRVDPDYWSPRRYTLGYVGVEGGWSQRYWTVGALVQTGFKIAGDASSMWAAYVSAKRWIGDDWSVGLTAYAQSGTRESKYRAEGATLVVEKLW